MKFIENLKKAFHDIAKQPFILAIPVFIDLLQLFIFYMIFKEGYIAPEKVFVMKLGTISAPPSICYFYDDFPSILPKYANNTGLGGMISQLNLLNSLLILSYTLILSFLKSAYMSCIHQCSMNKISRSGFFLMSCSHWHKFFILELVSLFPLILMLLSGNLDMVAIILLFCVVLFYYVKFSIVVDQGTFFQNIMNGLRVLSDHTCFTLWMSIFYGGLLSLAGFIVYSLGKLHHFGVVLAVLMVDFLGVCINKAILEVYKELREKELGSSSQDCCSSELHT